MELDDNEKIILLSVISLFFPTQKVSWKNKITNNSGFCFFEQDSNIVLFLYNKTPSGCVFSQIQEVIYSFNQLTDKDKIEIDKVRDLYLNIQDLINNKGFTKEDIVFGVDVFEIKSKYNSNPKKAYLFSGENAYDYFINNHQSFSEKMKNNLNLILSSFPKRKSSEINSKLEKLILACVTPNSKINSPKGLKL